MRLSLPPALGRLLAATLFVFLIGGIAGGVVMPVLDALAEAELSNDEYQLALGRGRALDRELKSVKAQLADIRQVQAAQSGFLDGANDSLATAQLQSRVKTIIETSGGELRSTQVLPVRDEGKFRRIIVRGQMAANIAAMQRIFYDIESASPYLFLDNIDIRARPSPRAQDNVPTDPMLDVRFDLYGYVRETP
jgi:general secretion pathway protein M